jgi:hypothetical protein
VVGDCLHVVPVPTTLFLGILKKRKAESPRKREIEDEFCFQIIYINEGSE